MRDGERPLNARLAYDRLTAMMRKPIANGHG